MSRNGSGTYSTPNTFVSGTTITAADHNENWSDLASEMTNSVAADGQTSMTGPLKAVTGTAALPALAFAADADTGIYRIGANNLGVAVAGAKVLDVSSTGLDVTGTVKQGGSALMPVGMGPLPWTGLTAPALWVFSGATYSRTTYASLWAFAQTEIANGSTWFTNGDGSTTFTIAGMEGHALVGVDSSATFLPSVASMGATTGTATKTIAQANLPAVTFAVTITDPGHTHALPNRDTFSAGAGGNQVTQDYTSGVTAGGDPVSVEDTGITATAASGGSGTALNVVQPVRACKFIFFAGA